MKKYVVVTAFFFICACKKDYLERYPLSEVSPQTFFNTEKDLQLYTNSLYDYVPGGTNVTDDLTSDNVEQVSANLVVAGRIELPATASAAGWTWGALRNINYFLQYYQKANVPDAVKANYAGVARFFRAWFYFDKVKRFGDVPWYSGTLEANSPELYKGRDTRTLVMDSIVADLDYAIQYLDTKKNISRVSKWTALALKSRVCLFEGTYRKYHTELGLTDKWADLLKQAAAAGLELINSNQYKLYTTGSPKTDYQNLFLAESANTDEVILAEVYDNTLLKTHNANGTFLTATNAGGAGLTKDLMDSYLMADGSFFSQVPGSDTFSFAKEVQNRDPRLAQTIRTPGYTRIGDTKKILPDFSVAPTGYQNIKFVTGINQDGYNTNTNDLPIFRYAEVLVNYAEAKAELKELNQTELDRSINVIRTRAGMPRLLATVGKDPLLQSQYPDVADALVLEVRRERRIELLFEGFRYYDLLRWKRGKLLEKIFEGMYIPTKGEIDLDGDGQLDFAVVDAKPATTKPTIQYYVLGTQKKLSQNTKGRIIVYPAQTKLFDENKYYLNPLPVSEMVLNKNLAQTPGW